MKLLLITIFLLLAAACGGPDLSNKNTPRPANANTPPPELEMSGAYVVTGSGENGTNPYEGILNVTNQQDVYLFKWQTTRPKPGGVGIQIGDAVAVSYADPTNGKGCGVALYRIAPDGALDGKIARWGEYKFGTERATADAGSGFAGKYSIAGSTIDGMTYAGRLTVTKNGPGYEFEWLYDFEWKPDEALVGFGIWRGDRAAISFGGRQCYFALYKIMSARSLEGHWGGQRDVVFGTETARRQ